MNKIFIISILLGVIILAGCTQISKQSSNFVDCKDNYDCLYNEIKNGNPAKVIITEEVESLNIIEKSLIEIKPSEKFEVKMTILDMKQAEPNADTMTWSISEGIAETCPQLLSNLNKIESKNAICYTNSPEDAKELAVKGLTDEFITKYTCNGELIDIISEICINEDQPDFPPGVWKPAIYLYPETSTNVGVIVNINGYITESIPTYGIGWNVVAAPNGVIDNTFDYLFYEAQLRTLDIPKEGWIIKSNEIENWFESTLPALGLNNKETFQFKNYWVEKLQDGEYYEIKLLSKSFLDNNMELQINPKPDKVIRLIFYFKPHSEKIEITEPTIKSPTRTGFTVVEWGGILDN